MANEFRGTDRYIATEELMAAVNAAVVLSRPLLIKANLGPARRCWRTKSRALWISRFRVAHQIHHQGPAGAVRI